MYEMPDPGTGGTTPADWDQAYKASYEAMKSCCRNPEKCTKIFEASIPLQPLQGHGAVFDRATPPRSSETRGQDFKWQNFEWQNVDQENVDRGIIDVHDRGPGARALHPQAPESRSAHAQARGSRTAQAQARAPGGRVAAGNPYLLQAHRSADPRAIATRSGVAGVVGLLIGLSCLVSLGVIRVVVKVK